MAYTNTWVHHIKKGKKYLACMLCGKRRIKPTRRYTSLGLTQIVHIGEGMCRLCAWEKVKLKCKICGEIIAKGFSRVLAHTAAHYTGLSCFFEDHFKHLRAIGTLPHTSSYAQN